MQPPPPTPMLEEVAVPLCEEPAGAAASGPEAGPSSSKWPIEEKEKRIPIAT